MNGTPLRAVFFDAVGTLIHPEPSAAAAYFAIGNRHGSRLDLATIRSAFAAAFRRQDDIDRQNDWRTSEQRELERWRTIVREVLQDVADCGRCFAELYEHFADPAHWRLDPDGCHVLNNLAQRGYSVGLASNFDHRLRRVLAGFPELHRVKEVFISAEIGWRKPSPRFFAEVAKKAELTPQETLYVGDDHDNDFVGALAAGWQAVLLEPATRKTGHIGGLTELLGLLTGQGGPCP